MDGHILPAPADLRGGLDDYCSHHSACLRQEGVDGGALGFELDVPGRSAHGAVEVGLVPRRGVGERRASARLQRDPGQHLDPPTEGLRAVLNGKQQAAADVLVRQARGEVAQAAVRRLLPGCEGQEVGLLRAGERSPERSGCPLGGGRQVDEALASSLDLGGGDGEVVDPDRAEPAIEEELEEAGGVIGRHGELALVGGDLVASGLQVAEVEVLVGHPVAVGALHTEARRDRAGSAGGAIPLVPEAQRVLPSARQYAVLLERVEGLVRLALGEHAPLAGERLLLVHGQADVVRGRRSLSAPAAETSLEVAVADHLGLAGSQPTRLAGDAVEPASGLVKP